MSDIAEMKKKTVSGAVSYMVRTVILFAIGFVSSLLLAAYLSPADFGIYGVVTQIIGILTFFSDIGLAAALVQKHKEPTTTEYRTVFTVQQVLSWLIFGITFLVGFSGIITPTVGTAGIWVLMALGFSFPLASLKTVSSVRLERKLDFSKLVLPAIFEQVAYNGALIFCAIRGMGVASYTVAVLARSIIGVIVMLWIEPWPIGIAWDQQAIRSMLGHGVKFQLNDFLARIKDQLFYLFLGLRLPIHEFGYISFAKQWSFLPYQLTVQNVIAITFPTYSRLQHDKNLLKKAIEKTTFFISLAIFPMLVGMCVFVIPFTSLIVKYQKWQPAVFTFILFTLSIGWGAISTPLTNTLNAIGKISVTLKLMIFWTALTWILTPLFMWKFGFNGVAWAAFAIGFTSILPIIEVRKIVNVDIWDQVWRQLLASIVMAVVGVLGLSYWQQSLVWMFGGMALTGFVYVVSVIVIGKEKLFAEVQSLRK